MKLLLSILALVATIHATPDIPDDTIDWSQVKHFMPRVPLPLGLDEVVRKERIVGGWESVPNELTYMAAVIATKAAGHYLCGGSLISLRDILTTAQCLIGASQVQVILGAHNFNILEVTQQRFYSSEFHIHHGWDDELLINDVAIVRLQSDAELNDYVSIVAMPLFADAVNTYAGEYAVVSGWGITSDGAVTPSDVLKKLYALVITNFLCNFSFLGIIQPTHICSSGEGHVGVCAGDAGGPLVIENKQIGIVSFALELGCEAQWPSVFTRTTAFLDWIEAHSDAHIA